MTIKQYLESLIEDDKKNLVAMVEVRQDDDTTVGFMNVEDMLDSDADYLSMGYESVDRQDDGSYVFVIES